MRKILCFALILFCLKVTCQNLECSDFKNGTFIVTVENPIRTVSKIIRRGNSQTEIILEMPKKIENTDLPSKLLVKLNWIDDCTYIGKFSVAKTKLLDYQKFINDNGGILIEKLKIEGRCMFYRSSLKLENETIVVNGKMCKE